MPESLIKHGDKLIKVSRNLKNTKATKYVIKNGQQISKRTRQLAKVGEQIGNFGKLVKNPGIKWVGSRQHALNRMAKHGINEQQVKSWIKNGKVIQQDADNFMFVTKDGVVILDKAGELQTAYSKNQFKDPIKQAIKQLYGP